VPSAITISARNNSIRPWRMLLSGLLGLLFTALGIVWYFNAGYYRTDLVIDFLPDKLQFVQGEGRASDKQLIIESLSQNDLALLSSPRGFVFEAAQLDRLHWCLETSFAGLRIQVLWLVGGQPLQRAVLPSEPGCHDFIISQQPAWNGVVNGFGLQLEYAEPLPEPVVLSDIRLLPAVPPLGPLLQQIWSEWREYQFWRTSSVHFIRLGAWQALLPLSLTLVLWALLSTLLYKLLAWRSKLTVVLFGFLIAAWIVNDGIWQVELAQRLQDTHRQFAHLTVPERLRVYDGELIDLVNAVRAELPPEPQRIFFLADAKHRTQKLRAHYHLSPHYVDSQSAILPSPDQIRTGDYILILGRIEQLRYHGRRGQETLFWGTNNQFQLPVQPLLADYGGVLFEVRD